MTSAFLKRFWILDSRPPHGGRGLKFASLSVDKCHGLVALPTEGVD